MLELLKPVVTGIGWVYSKLRGNPLSQHHYYEKTVPAVMGLKDALMSHSLVYTNALCNPDGRDSYHRSSFKTYEILRSSELFIPPKVKHAFIKVMNGYELALNGMNQENPVDDYEKFVEICRKHLAR